MDTILADLLAFIQDGIAWRLPPGAYERKMDQMARVPP